MCVCVCRSILKAERYALQHGLETGDKLRGALAEIKGQIRSRKTWEDDARSCAPHLSMTDYRSLSDHLASEILAKVSDKCLGTELQSIHESFWTEGEKTWTLYPSGGDRLQWIEVHYDQRLPHQEHETGFYDPCALRLHVQGAEAVGHDTA